MSNVSALALLAPFLAKSIEIKQFLAFFQRPPKRKLSFNEYETSNNKNVFFMAFLVNTSPAEWILE